MSKFNLENLSPLAQGRLRQQLDKLYSFGDGVFTLRYAIERLQTVEKTVSDGMMDYNRRYFNRLGSNEVAAFWSVNLWTTAQRQDGHALTVTVRGKVHIFARRDL